MPRLTRKGICISFHPLAWNGEAECLLLAYLGVWRLRKLILALSGPPGLRHLMELLSWICSGVPGGKGCQGKRFGSAAGGVPCARGRWWRCQRLQRCGDLSVASAGVTLLSSLDPLVEPLGQKSVRFCFFTSVNRCCILMT